MQTEVCTPSVGVSISNRRPSTHDSPFTTCTLSSNVRNTHPFWLGRWHSISACHVSMLERRLIAIASSIEKNPSQRVFAIPLQSSCRSQLAHARSGGHFSSTSSTHHCTSRVREPGRFALSTTSAINPYAL